MHKSRESCLLCGASKDKFCICLCLCTHFNAYMRIFNIIIYCLCYMRKTLVALCVKPIFYLFSWGIPTQIAFIYFARATIVYSKG